VDVISAGYFNFAQGAKGDLALVAGTSFASPTVAGAAALLRSAVPKATATQVRNAIVLGANPNVFDDKSAQLDRGKGYLDVNKSFTLLSQHKAPGRLPPFPPFFGDVGLNVAKFGIVPVDLTMGTPRTLKGMNLLPGQRKEFLVRIGKNVGNLQVQINGVTPLLPPEHQNQIFGDDVIVAVHQAKTSAHGEGDYPVFDFFNGPDAAAIENPEPGYMRVVILGDWTNAGNVSASLTLTATPKPSAVFSKFAKISEGDLQTIPFTMPSGVNVATFELDWDNDWSHYPTNDLDLILVDPDGNMDFDGATMNGLESAVVKHPKPGNWTILVDGFDIFGKLADDGSESGPQTDTYHVRVFAQ
jgi:hypothetical protein